MINTDVHPAAAQDNSQPNENEPNRKFPSDDSNVGDNPIYPDEEDTIPVNNDTPSEIGDDSLSSQQNNVDQEVGSDKGGVQPYNINSNTSDESDDDDDSNGIETETGPLDTNKDQDFENPDQDSENSHR